MRCGKTCTLARLFDHLVGDGEQRRRRRETKRLGLSQVDDQLEFGRLLDRDFARLRSGDIAAWHHDWKEPREERLLPVPVGHEESIGFLE